MRRSRWASSAGMTALALAVAAGGALANLRLLEPRSSPGVPVALQGDAAAPEPTGAPRREGGDSPPGTTTSTTAAPPTTGGADTSAPPPTTSTTMPPVTTAPSATTVSTPTSSRSYVVGEAGTVVLSVRAGRLAVDAIRPAAGWTYLTQKQTAEELEIIFKSSEEQTSLHAHIENGQLRVEIGGPSEPPDD